MADTGVGAPAPGGPNLRTVSAWGCFICMLLCFQLLEGGDVHFFVHGSSEPVTTLNVKCALRPRCATSPFTTGQVCHRISASMCCRGRAQRMSGTALFGRAPAIWLSHPTASARASRTAKRTPKGSARPPRRGGAEDSSRVLVPERLHQWCCGCSSWSRSRPSLARNCPVQPALQRDAEAAAEPAVAWQPTEVRLPGHPAATLRVPGKSIFRSSSKLVILQ